MTKEEAKSIFAQACDTGFVNGIDFKILERTKNCIEKRIEFTGSNLSIYMVEDPDSEDYNGYIAWDNPVFKALCWWAQNQPDLTRFTSEMKHRLANIYYFDEGFVVEKYSYCCDCIGHPDQGDPPSFEITTGRILSLNEIRLRMIKYPSLRTREVASRIFA